jgi:hypothetical protein
MLAGFSIVAGGSFAPGRICVKAWHRPFGWRGGGWLVVAERQEGELYANAARALPERLAGD